ncbi:ribosomal protein S13 [Planoprotostelium fungivorum]|uniref:Ribosomal protein S13 (Mitochondrion) n=1 Tax=Planoprotostelium fungivorum TaxID=1890364 RepID=A0A2P6NNK3_9EUKA|nr:ribosomal protein S13 [Planoprotostelium fungivorum]
MAAEATRYILGHTIKTDKIFLFSLREIYGIGHASAGLICDRFGISRQARLKNLPDYKISTLESYVNKNVLLGKDLKEQVTKNIQKKIADGGYIGRRLAEQLPAYGQRTHKNARTARRVKNF